MIPKIDWTPSENEFGLVFSSLPAVQKAKEPRTAGGPGSGNFGHAGRPGEVGGSAPDEDAPSDAVAEARPFKGNEGYEWHERPEMAEYVKTMPYEEAKAIESYASFGYGDVNRQLRGTFEPRIINEFVRPATPEEIAQYNKGITDPRGRLEAYGGWPPSDANEYKPDDPVNKVEDGRLVHNVFTKDPATGETVEWSVQRATPDTKYVKELNEKAAKINTAIREYGYELEEPIEVNRAAYIPGLSYDDLKAMEGSIIEEKGFSSTMVGNPGNRLDGYVALAKSESLYKRYGEKESSAIYDHQDEVGSAMRIKIVLPEGTKVAPVEAIRRTDYAFPKKQDPSVFDHPEWLTEGLKAEDFKITDFAATPTITTERLTDKEKQSSQRSEAEILLGSGAQFRVVSVQRGERRIVTSDPSFKPVDVVDVTMEYVGGGSSDGRS